MKLIEVLNGEIAIKRPTEEMFCGVFCDGGI